jgi:hypothetical protein
VQYAADEYVKVLRQHQMIPSMSRPANPYDNAGCESFMKTLKREEIYANDYRDLDHLRTNIEAFIEQYYNRCRLHSALGYKPPEEFEQAAVESEPTSAGATMSFFRHEEIYRPDSTNSLTRSGRPLLRPSVSMSLRLVIPWRVALQQSSPPLHQPTEILNEKRYFEKTNLWTASVLTENCLNRGVHPNSLRQTCDKNTDKLEVIGGNR